MDSLAYSVMLEISTNTAAIDKSLQKSLNIVKDHEKEMTKAYDKVTKSAINYHKGLKEELSIIEKIGVAIGKVAKAVVELHLAIVGIIGGAIVGLVKAVATVITAGISHIDGYIDQAMDNYSNLLEKYRFANIQAAGGVSVLHKQMVGLMGSLGATREQAEAIVFAMANAGFRATKSSEDFKEISETMWGLERITGISVVTSARFAKSLTGIGLSATQSSKLMKGFADMMFRSNLTADESSEIMSNVRSQMFKLSGQFGTDSVQKYTKALGDLAGAAKMIGVDVSKATELMTNLNNSPMDFIVALGSDALYKSAGENIETLIMKSKDIRKQISTLPPGMQEQFLKQVYHMDMAQLKMLEGVQEFRDTYPAVAGLWEKLSKQANQSFDAMYKILYSKIMAPIERISGELMRLKVNIFDTLTAGVGEKLGIIMDKIATLFQRILGDGSGLVDWAKSANDWMNKTLESLIKWLDAISKPDYIKDLKKSMNDIYEKLENGVKVAWTWIQTNIQAFAKWFDNWVETGGPDNLLKTFKDVLTTIGDVALAIRDWMPSIKEVVVDLKAAFLAAKATKQYLTLDFEGGRATEAEGKKVVADFRMEQSIDKFTKEYGQQTEYLRASMVDLTKEQREAKKQEMINVLKRQQASLAQDPTMVNEAGARDAAIAKTLKDVMAMSTDPTLKEMIKQNKLAEDANKALNNGVEAQTITADISKEIAKNTDPNKGKKEEQNFAQFWFKKYGMGSLGRDQQEAYSSEYLASQAQHRKGTAIEGITPTTVGTGMSAGQIKGAADLWKSQAVEEAGRSAKSFGNEMFNLFKSPMEALKSPTSLLTPITKFTDMMGKVGDISKTADWKNIPVSHLIPNIMPVDIKPNESKVMAPPTGMKASAQADHVATSSIRSESTSPFPSEAMKHLDSLAKSSASIADHTSKMANKKDKYTKSSPSPTVVAASAFMSG